MHKTKGWKGTTSAGKRGGKGGNKLREKGRQRAQKTRREGDNGCRKKRQAGQGEQKKAMGLATPTSERCATMATTVPTNWSLPHLLNVSSRAFTASIGEEIIVLRSCAPDSSLRTMRRDVRHWCTSARFTRPLLTCKYPVPGTRVLMLNIIITRWVPVASYSSCAMSHRRSSLIIV